MFYAAATPVLQREALVTQFVELAEIGPDPYDVIGTAPAGGDWEDSAR